MIEICLEKIKELQICINFRNGQNRIGQILPHLNEAILSNVILTGFFMTPSIATKFQ
jgi:hypothetical protein